PTVRNALTTYIFLARSKRLALLSASEAIASNSLTMSFRGMLRSTNERILASRSIIYSLRLLQVRYEQAVGHALLKVPDHRRLACRDRDCQRLAPSRSELDDIGPIALRAIMIRLLPAIIAVSFCAILPPLRASRPAHPSSSSHGTSGMTSP